MTLSPRQWNAVTRKCEEIRARVASEPTRPPPSQLQIDEARELAECAPALHEQADALRGDPDRCARQRRAAVDMDMAADQLCPVEHR